MERMARTGIRQGRFPVQQLLIRRVQRVKQRVGLSREMRSETSVRSETET